MIQIKKKIGATIPLVLSTKGIAAAQTLIERYNNGERSFESKSFDSGIYGHDEVKETLINIQDYKCCFCESKIGHISYGDVEHFRPKAGWVQNSEAINKPGYYWLSYSFDNLLLSCQICNQRYKKNLFPILPNSTRAISHNDNVGNESPVFIHPALDNPEDFIGFNEEVPFAINGNIRGKETINKLGLDRGLLQEQRMSKLGMVRDIYNLAKAIPNTNPALQQRAKEILEKYKTESALDSTEYASMLRCFFKANPINF
jgi:uncharacterized protein (TIGR02646 family)